MSDARIDTVSQILLLYELSLATGHSLDLEETCRGFVDVLMARKDLSYARVWINNPACTSEEITQDYRLVYAVPDMRAVVHRLPACDPMFRFSAGESFRVVTANDAEFSRVIQDRNVTGGACALFNLRNLGLLTLYTSRQEGFPLTEINQLRSVVDKFAISISGALAHRRERIKSAALESAQHSLEQQAALLRSLIDSAPDLIFIKDHQSRYLGCNRAFEAYAGRIERELVGCTDFDLFDPKKAEYYRHKDAEMMTSGLSQNNEEWIDYPDGRRVLLDTLITPYCGPDDEVLGLIGIGRDITARKQAEDALRQKESYQRALLDNFPFLIWLKDTESRFLSVNQPFATAAGYTDINELTGKNDLDIWPRDLAQAYREDDRSVMRMLQKKNIEEEIIHNGRRRWFETYKAPVLDPEGQLFGTVGFSRDITERKETEEKLRLSSNVFSHAREGITITTSDGTIVEVNEAFTRITGYSRSEVLGQNTRILKSDRQSGDFYADMWHKLGRHGQWSGEIWNQRKNGEVYPAMLTISAVCDAENEVRHYVALFSDITAQKEQQRQLEYIAHYDAVTGLPNRVLLADRLHQAMAQAQRHGQRLAVAYLDLDGFKSVNDSHGHQVGDQLLMTVAIRMKQVLREGDTIARLGGDEFVAVLNDLADTNASMPMLVRLLSAAAQPARLGDLSLQITACLGVTYYPQRGEVDADQLLRQADHAMYQAKLSGRNRYHIFDTELDRSVRGHHEHLDDIRHALDRDEFVLYYQPKVNMRSGEIHGVEALIRWRHPRQGLLMPDDFLPTIEEHPLAIDLGEWVINTALSQHRAWKLAGMNIPVSVNIGGYQLQQPDFIERLMSLMGAYPDIEPNCLEIEVLETSALEDMAHVTRVIQACKQIGVLFALDDFGTGYSSLTYLKNLPSAHLKIDRSFVHDMLEDPDDLAILEGVLGLAMAFRRQAIAEGVESLDQGEMLLQLGCELAQGYIIARPMPAGDFPAWARSWHPDPRWGRQRAISRDDLPLLFAGVEHRAWIRSIKARLQCRQTDAPVNYLQCRFSQWLENEGRDSFADRPTLRLVESLHRKVHNLASELLTLSDQGNRQAALERMDELDSLRDDLLKQLSLPIQSSG